MRNYISETAIINKHVPFLLCMHVSLQLTSSNDRVRLRLRSKEQYGDCFAKHGICLESFCAEKVFKATHGAPSDHSTMSRLEIFQRVLSIHVGFSEIQQDLVFCSTLKQSKQKQICLSKTCCFSQPFFVVTCSRKFPESFADIQLKNAGHLQSKQLCQCFIIK